MKAWACSLLFAFAAGAQVLASPPVRPLPPVVRPVDVRADETPARRFAVNDRIPDLSVDGRAVPPLDYVVVPGAGEEKGAGR